MVTVLGFGRLATSIAPQNDRRVLKGIFGVVRSGAPRRDLPETCDPRTTCYSRFIRWQQASLWGRIMDALAAIRIQLRTYKSTPNKFPGLVGTPTSRSSIP